MKKTEREILLDTKTGEEKKKTPQKNSFPQSAYVKFLLFWSPHYRHLMNSVAKTLNENGSRTYRC